MPEVVMPRLSDSMEEGKIVRWVKTSGEHVTVGEELVEIETDKATVSYEAELSGILTIVVAEGQTVPVGAVIGEIGLNGSAPSGRRAKASPVARRLAQRHGVDLEAVSGTGPEGRIVKRDVLEAAGAGLGAVAETPAAAQSGVVESVPLSAPPSSVKGDVETTQATSIQSTIARRMTEAKATIPDFTLTTEVTVDALLELRAQLRQLELDPAPSVNDFVIKACARALRGHPRVNASYRDGAFERYTRVNVGVAVAATDALLVPTVFDADSKSLARIAVEARELAERARAGRLTPAELDGATFTISNLGMFGITQFTAVINPPQAAILAVGSVQEGVAWRDGAATGCRRMSLTLTCDHRILYGADAAAFLKDIRTDLEQPLRMLL